MDENSPNTGGSSSSSAAAPMPVPMPVPMPAPMPDDAIHLSRGDCEDAEDDQDDCEDFPAVISRMDYASANAALLEAKLAGNDALKGTDLPAATEKYEEALHFFDTALSQAPQAPKLQQNEIVRYTWKHGGFALIDIPYHEFGDYILSDLGHGDIVKERIGRYEDVPKRFKRDDLQQVPKELFDVRLACLNNLSLVSLKNARATKRPEDFQDTVLRANAALCMGGSNAKALMRMGTALLELKEVEKASKVLMAAHKLTKGQDIEVLRLLQLVLYAKGKGKGKGKQKGPPDPHAICRNCNDPCCEDPNCGVVSYSSDSEDERIGLSMRGRPLKTTEENPDEDDDEDQDFLEDEDVPEPQTKQEAKEEPVEEKPVEEKPVEIRYTGPSWTCEQCDEPNKGNRVVCNNCSAPRVKAEPKTTPDEEVEEESAAPAPERKPQDTFRPIKARVSFADAKNETDTSRSVPKSSGKTAVHKTFGAEKTNDRTTAPKEGAEKTNDRTTAPKEEKFINIDPSKSLEPSRLPYKMMAIIATIVLAVGGIAVMLHRADAMNVLIRLIDVPDVEGQDPEVDL